MQSDRIQQRINTFLDEADEAAAQSDWARVRDRAQNVLAFDPQNSDALSYIAAAERAVAAAPPSRRGKGREQDSDDEQVASLTASPDSPLGARPPPQPTSFVDGRYVVKKFLGEGGKKRVFLAHDSKLDRDVAREHLDFAIEEFRVMKMQPALGAGPHSQGAAAGISEAPELLQ